MRKLITICALVAIAIPATQVMADFVPPSSFPAGTTQYEILFTTSGTLYALSAPIDDTPLPGPSPGPVGGGRGGTPEPATLTLLVSGFLAIGGFGIVRRRRGTAAKIGPQK
jgi:hypothetical protein